ncbi:hydroxylase [Caldimonas thermodepolymerans]|uniref:Alkylation response protein AidB-like acyl-CoA dehydrogenase n=1 Tax=Caldimonas thermodepolymerans TaxID=215580 RepID=A0AA46DBY0_9BURK|nr:hydroxylase [Caldimonas thermodepolymerans]TCP03233.1 alkylation response protein AidB-like acyl-CoA dehydrogenase [Caldimonas thermodepolymerans]UZG44262.1 hydroxylase [Caldimonas thermodepolymerans]UZG47928.1 hydroxylase [Caldimonas thermodepolymerans]
MSSVLEFIKANAERIKAEVEPSDKLGRVSDAAAKILLESGVVRMLQPKQYGGFESDPCDFLKVVMETTALAPSIGWVAGVVGIHPFEFGQGDPRMQEEVWGKDHDTWTSSPYAFFGRAKRVEGGYILNGRWPFSSGSDHCTWAVLGVLAEDENGPKDAFTRQFHFILPRSDYEILQDSWQVMGLQGTGSKDILVKDAFVPDYRTIDVDKLNNQEYASANRPGIPLYQVPFDLIFPGAIAAATVGIADGLVRHFADYAASRTTRGLKSTNNPYQMAALGAAIADIEASKEAVLAGVREAFEIAKRGEKVDISVQRRARVRQVRAVRRAAEIGFQVFRHAGGNASRLSSPIQRQWRDLSVALGHACNQDDMVYAAYAGTLYDLPVAPGVII